MNSVELPRVLGLMMLVSIDARGVGWCLLSQPSGGRGAGDEAGQLLQPTLHLQYLTLYITLAEMVLVLST